MEEYNDIIKALESNGCKKLKTRTEYTLLKQVVVTENDNHGNLQNAENPCATKPERSGVISPLCGAKGTTDTPSKVYSKPFLAALDVQKNAGISDVIPFFGVIQSERLRLNIGLDTEFQTFSCGIGSRKVLSVQMSIAISDYLLRYFFLIDPEYQDISVNGGKIPLKFCLADILSDLKKSLFHDFPLVLKRDFIYRKYPSKDHASFKVVDFNAMADSVIPITIVCNGGKADISVFRRSKYDIDVIRNLSEIQGGWMSTQNIRFKAENDRNYNYYWLVDLSIRDTLGLTPAENQSLSSLGQVIKHPKIELPQNVIEHMAEFAVTNPVDFYHYAVNDADIVILFCSELFLRNHAIPITLSSAAAVSMRQSIQDYFGVLKRSDYDRLYRGLELLDEGIIRSEDESMKFLKATRYVPLRDNPDACLISEFFEEAYTGGFNASFYIGWITHPTTDFDLQNAYPTAMANIIDIDWSKNVSDFSRNYNITLDDLFSPLIPAVAIGDFDFPDDCYCPNIPVPVKGGMKIYPLHAKNVYMTGPDMYLALKLGAKIKISRGFKCAPLKRNGKLSRCLSYAVANLVQDRTKAKNVFKDNKLIEKTLKTAVCSCYGKTAQNVSPKTRYNSKTMGRVDADPSAVTSPYHAAYTTALVRCMLIACVNQLRSMGFYVYSVTTDGFITDAPITVVRSLDAFGFSEIFQQGRYILNQTTEPCDANQVWEAKHSNEIFLNITTRGNVAVNDEGVLAHNSFSTGEVKGSRADRDAFLIAVLTREGRLKCKTNIRTQFSELVERKHDFQVTESARHISMNFDFKRCPLIETAVDTPVHYAPADGQNPVDTVLANYDTRPFSDAQEFGRYRSTLKNEDCVKMRADLERVKVKSTVQTKGYIGKDLNRKILLSILMGFRSGLYPIPALEGLKQSEVVSTVNGWDIAQITLNDWKNCSRSKRQASMLPYDVIEGTLKKIQKY